MGTFYTAGPIVEFQASARQALTDSEWEETLNQRIDTTLFDVTISENNVTAKMKEELFKQHIFDLYDVVKQMSYPLVNECLGDYKNHFGDNLEEQSKERASLYAMSPTGEKITIKCQFAMMFLEGKVLAEEFYTEPQMFNWLFKNSAINNPLKGCMISGIVG